MILTSKNNFEFRLDVLDYAYPNTKNPEDLNWLTCLLTVSKQDNQWTYQSPCLQPFELNRLLEWLPLTQKDRLEFIEPTLAFSRKGFWKHGVIFHLHFFYECPITDIFPELLEDEDGCPFVELQLTNAHLLTVSNTLKELLLSYPQK